MATTNVAHGVGRRRTEAELGRGRGYDSWCRVKLMLRPAMALTFVLFLVTAAGAQVTVKGDAAAWREVMAAYENLGKLKSFRMKMTPVGQTEGAFVIEKVNPDRSRMLIQSQQGVGIESIAVGNEVRSRVNTGTNQATAWQCGPAPVQAGSEPNPLKAKGEVTISRLPDATIEGTRTRGYRSTMTTDGKPNHSRIFVLVDRGLPRRTEVLDDAGSKMEMTIDYYDFNAPITIDLPKCG